jgi:hypothetical protein
MMRIGGDLKGFSGDPRRIKGRGPIPSRHAAQQAHGTILLVSHVLSRIENLSAEIEYPQIYISPFLNPTNRTRRNPKSPNERHSASYMCTVQPKI